MGTVVGKLMRRIIFFAFYLQEQPQRSTKPTTSAHACDSQQVDTRSRWLDPARLDPVYQLSERYQSTKIDPSISQYRTLLHVLRRCIFEHTVLWYHFPKSSNKDMRNICNRWNIELTWRSHQSSPDEFSSQTRCIPPVFLLTYLRSG